MHKRDDYRLGLAIGDHEHVVGHHGEIRALPAHRGADIKRYLVFLARLIFTKNDRPT
jgi:hypothetical protein